MEVLPELGDLNALVLLALDRRCVIIFSPIDREGEAAAVVGLQPGRLSSFVPGYPPTSVMLLS